MGGFLQDGKVFVRHGVRAPHQLRLRVDLEHGRAEAFRGIEGVEGHVLRGGYIAHGKHDVGLGRFYTAVVAHFDEAVRATLVVLEHIVYQLTFPGQSQVEVLHGVRNPLLGEAALDQSVPVFVGHIVFIFVGESGLPIFGVLRYLESGEEGNNQKDSTAGEQGKSLNFQTLHGAASQDNKGKQHPGNPVRRIHGRIQVIIESRGQGRC